MSDDVEAGKMRFALAAIADEMQNLQNNSPDINSKDSVNNSEEILNKLIGCKSSLKAKKEEIKKLKQNLQTACFIAKTVTSAKQNETALLNNHLSFARNQYLDLIQQHKDESETINNLRTENRSLRDNLEHFNNSIELGYQQLQKMRNENFEKISILKQLKKIIVCCGQYYADYCNEHDKCLRLEQKNRFLNNKLRILECNLEAAPNISMNNKNNKNKENLTKKSDARSKSRGCVNVGIVCSEYQMKKNQRNISNVTMTKIELNKHSPTTKNRELDLSSHLDVVKRLIRDQDSLLKDLKGLSKEIIHVEPYLS